MKNAIIGIYIQYYDGKEEIQLSPFDEWQSGSAFMERWPTMSDWVTFRLAN